MSPSTSLTLAISAAEPSDGSHLASAAPIIAGSFELVRQLKRTPTGYDCIAVQLTTGRFARISILQQDVAGRARADLLVRQARVLTGLRHPDLVDVLETDWTELGEPFIARELLTGEPLVARLGREQRLDPSTAATVLMPVIEALEFAHGQGLIYGDLSPAKIHLTQVRGGVRAKLLHPAEAPFELLERRLRAALSLPNRSFGDPDYLAPEQVHDDQPVDQRADIWSFCAVLYECVTGHPPFDESNYARLVQQILERPAPPLATTSAANAALWAILSRGLEKSPKARWQTMQQLSQALSGWLWAHGGQLEPSTWSGVRRIGEWEDPTCTV